MVFEWQFTVYAIPLVVSALATSLLFLLVFSYRKRSRAAIPLLAVLLASTLWATGDAMRLLSVTGSEKLFWNNVRFLGGSFITPAMFLLVLEYVNVDHWITRRRIAAISIVPVLTNVVAWTNPYHHLLRKPAMVERATFLGDEIVHLPLEYGVWYDVHLLYSYPFLLASAYFLLKNVRNPDEFGTYRMQAAMLLLSFLVPVLLNLPFALGLLPVDVTAFGFGVTASVFAVAIVRYRLLDILPVARKTVVDTIDSGVLVLDPDDHIVDVNERGAAIIGADQSSIVGEPFETRFSEFPVIVERFGDKRRNHDRIALDRDGETRHYDVEVSPLYSDRRYLGRVIVFRDATAHVRRRRELEVQTRKLERQNDRLENVARIVSHDLRNPLGIATGHLDLARETGDDAHFDAVGDSLERMSQIVDDVLTLARHGQAVVETEPLDLDRVCRTAWRNVDPDGATLECDASLRIEADEGRLLQMLENLFRNAVEHGGEDVTVTVGPLDDGFYVTDDGPGIPEDERGCVFEWGYTTNQDGTGLGLGIVSTLADAHDWSVDVTEGADGGARLEIRDARVQALDD